MKFIAIGELMLRLSPPNYDMIVTTHDFIVNYGGAEANVAVSLANLGVDSSFFTVLPNTDLGKSTINYLKANDVHTKHIIKADGRMGLYYLEEGVAVRASQVIYDRGNSAFAEYDYSDVDFEDILKEIRNYLEEHSGITNPKIIDDKMQTTGGKIGNYLSVHKEEIINMSDENSDAKYICEYFNWVMYSDSEYNPYDDKYKNTQEDIIDDNIK